VTSASKTTPVVEEVPVATVSPVKALTNDQPKALLKDAGATGCSKLRKDELIAKLAEVTSASKTTPVVEEVPVATVSPVKAEVTAALAARKSLTIWTSPSSKPVWLTLRTSVGAPC
jgi:hypothetical protein